MQQSLQQINEKRCVKISDWKQVSACMQKRKNILHNYADNLHLHKRVNMMRGKRENVCVNVTGFISCSDHVLSRGVAEVGGARQVVLVWEHSPLQ